MFNKKAEILINIADQYGSHLLKVLKLDGTPAIENIDYVIWIGKEKKEDGKVFIEKGVRLTSGIIIYEQRSDHASYNKRKHVRVIRNGKDFGSTMVTSGNLSPTAPPILQKCFRTSYRNGNEGEWKEERIFLSNEVRKIIIQYILSFYPETVVRVMMKKWEKLHYKIKK